MNCLHLVLLFCYFTTLLGAPQEPPKPVTPTKDDVVVVNEANTELKAGTVCDFTSCNGLIAKFLEKIGIKGEFGQCAHVDENGDAYCFVNEDSPCEKLSHPLIPGTSASIEPCKDPRAPKPRSINLNFAPICLGVSQCNSRSRVNNDDETYNTNNYQRNSYERNSYEENNNSYEENNNSYEENKNSYEENNAYVNN